MIVNFIDSDEITFDYDSEYPFHVSKFDLPYGEVKINKILGKKKYKVDNDK